MEVKLSQAVKMFFGQSSLEKVYIEAIANSLDAKATEINIDIYAKSYKDIKTLVLAIKDNGIGFTEKRYKKFCRLFDVEENSHKGLGRLVYPCYFDSIEIESIFNKTQKRNFAFTEELNENNSKINKVKEQKNGTIIKMSDYTLTKLYSHNFIQPKYLKQRILEEFYPIFFLQKQQENKFVISINSKIENLTLSETISSKDIPILKKVKLDSFINIFDNFYLYYSIQKVKVYETSLITAVNVDHRTKKVEIIANENTPKNYKMVFLLFSDWFTGKVDFSRQSLNVSDNELKQIQIMFRKKVASIIEEEIPEIKKRNKQTKNNLINKYPHLSGYFINENIGYNSRSDILKKAQEDFFRDQKKLLEATSLTDEQFEKSIEISSRALTEYILFRQLTIDKLKKSTNKNSEAELHKLFATMKVKFDKNNFVNDLYRNNAWLLDDKYMTYETILSDREMGDLIKFITEGENTERDADRPDMALVFSNNPNKGIPFDIVIVELKKRGEKLEENMKAITQLEKRARKLMMHFKNKIQRIWYYGIIEFNDDIELALSGEYTELYSSGKMYYRETNVAIQLNPKIILPIGVFIWDINAVIEDADARNSAFLNLIKSKFIEK